MNFPGVGDVLDDLPGRQANQIVLESVGEEVFRVFARHHAKRGFQFGPVASGLLRC